MVKLLNDKTLPAVFANDDIFANAALFATTAAPTIPSTVFATFDNSVLDTVITFGTQFVPFHVNAYPSPGAMVDVSTSAKSLILFNEIFALTLITIFEISAADIGNTQRRVPSVFADSMSPFAAGKPKSGSVSLSWI